MLILLIFLSVITVIGTVCLVYLVERQHTRIRANIERLKKDREVLPKLEYKFHQKESA